ncbi:hypothetical protein JW766_05385 [Candidatus Dojkabacteria bacterium]|nr:hypothetical protein [Candidatus Dojkabacteria bacterium]
MADGTDAELSSIKQKESSAIFKPPELKDAVPIGQPEQDIVNRIVEDGDPDQVFSDIAGEQNENVPSERAMAKSEGAMSLIDSSVENPPKGALASEIDKKVDGFKEVTDSDSTQIYEGGALGEIIIDKDKNLVKPNMTPKAQSAVLVNYATTAAAISARYTSGPNVDLLPPEAYKIDTFAALQKRVDGSGVVLTVLGEKAKTKTRFYSIPGQQLDEQRKPILLSEQRILVVQDLALDNGNTRRIYAVSTAADIDDYLDKMITAQIEQSSDTSSSQLPQEQQTEAITAPKSSEEVVTPVPISEEVINAYLDELKLQVPKVKEGGLTQAQLQSLVDEAKAAGVSLDRMRAVLEAQGVKIKQREKKPKEKLEDLAERASPFLDKLRQKFPEQPGGDGRLGTEILISEEEMSLIKEIVDTTRNFLIADPSLKSLIDMIQQKLGKDKGFDSAHGWGILVREDNTIQSPQLGKADGHPIIKTPPETYRLWRAKNGLDIVENLMNLGTEYTGPYKGRSASALLKPLEFGIQAALEL